jgi:predicted nuclease with RNAse H fold
MITAGVDLSSQAKRTGACVIGWSHGRAKVANLSLGVTDREIIELTTTADKVGIDAPLGWPIAFAEAVAGHSRDGSWPPTYEHADTSNFRLRRTDLWIWRDLRLPQPLSVSTDRIALPAMRATALLSTLPERVRLDGSGVVVEVYPSAALNRWGLPSRAYKGKNNHEGRRAPIAAFIAATEPWLDLDGPDKDLCVSSDDAFDALVAALVARAAAMAFVEPIPEEDRAVALREGWIAIPLEGSLSQLAGSR